MVVRPRILGRQLGKCHHEHGRLLKSCGVGWDKLARIDGATWTRSPRAQAHRESVQWRGGPALASQLRRVDSWLARACPTLRAWACQITRRFAVVSVTRRRVGLV